MNLGISVQYEHGAPRPDTPGSWSRTIAMRLDKGILEQVETLEEKVVSASMQVKVSYTEKCVCKM